jgi:hypothetical protein
VFETYVEAAARYSHEQRQQPETTMTDQQITINAVRESRLVLAEFLEPNSSDAVYTVQQLREILDIREVKCAIERLERCANGLPLAR